MAIDPAHDLDLQYCWAFRRVQVFDWARSRGYIQAADLVAHLGDRANRAAVDASLRAAAVDLITGSGHGRTDEYQGYGNTVLWNTTTTPPPPVRGVVHLLACSCGSGLSHVFMDQGARQFWGYSQPFKFHHHEPFPYRLEEDSLADAFLSMDTLIDQGLLQGLDRDTIYSNVRRYVARTASGLLSQPRGALSRQLLLRNFGSIVASSATL